MATHMTGAAREYTKTHGVIRGWCETSYRDPLTCKPADIVDWKALERWLRDLGATRSMAKYIAAGWYPPAKKSKKTPK